MRIPGPSPISPGHIALRALTEDPNSPLGSGVYVASSHLMVHPTLHHAFGAAEWYVMDCRLPMPGNLPEWAVRAWDHLATFESPSFHLALVSFDGGKSVQMYTVYVYILEEDGRGHASANFVIFTPTPTPSAQA